jgi:chemotaxis protein histidine kinase CheA
MAESYMVASAAEILYAIPISVIQECIAVPVSAKNHTCGAEEVPVVRVSESRSATAGIVVLAGDGKAVLVFDTVVGEESLMPSPAEYAGAPEPGIIAAAARADGGVALVLDVASYVSALRPEKKKRKSRPPKKKPGRGAGER